MAMALSHAGMAKRQNGQSALVSVVMGFRDLAVLDGKHWSEAFLWAAALAFASPRDAETLVIFAGLRWPQQGQVSNPPWKTYATAASDSSERFMMPGVSLKLRLTNMSPLFLVAHKPWNILLFGSLWKFQGWDTFAVGRLE